MIVSPGMESNIAWRSVPGPLSATLFTAIVFPSGRVVRVGAGSVIAGVGGAAVIVGGTVVRAGDIVAGAAFVGITVGDGVCPQAFNASERTAARSNRLVRFLIVYSDRADERFRILLPEILRLNDLFYGMR
jgi:hypothetical protein